MKNLNEKIEKLGSPNALLLIIITTCLVTFAIWLPFGFSLTALIEEWSILGLFTTHGLFFIANTSGPLAAHALRPLTIFPHALAYWLDPHSFKFWHILLILVLIIKGSTAGYLVLRVSHSFFLAVVMSALVLVYPADTMQLSFRALHINWSLSLVLLASTFLLIAYTNKSYIISFCYGLLASSLFFASMCMYEAALMFMILPFSMLYIDKGLEALVRQMKQRWFLVISWLTAIGVYLLYVYYISTLIKSYQSSIMEGSSLFEILKLTLPKLISIALVRSLLGGWGDALQIFIHQLGTLGQIYDLICVGCIFILISKTRQIHTSHNNLKIMRMSIIGVILLFCGHFPFVLLPSHMIINQRTYLFASFGASMCFIALFMLIEKINYKIAYALAFFLILLGLSSQLYQFKHYNAIANTQRSLLKSIVENFDGELHDKTLLILDKSNQLNHTWFFLTCSFYLQHVLTYFYDHPITKIKICHLPSYEWEEDGSLGRKGKCIENKKSWLFKYHAKVEGPNVKSPPVPNSVVLSKKDIVTLVIGSNGAIQPNHRHVRNHHLMTEDNTTAKRYQNILNRKQGSYNNLFWVSTNEQAYRWQFGNFWSLELPIRGSGWQEAEWNIKYFNHHAFAWKIEKEASLLFNLEPKEKNYILRGKFEMILNDNIRKSIKIKINQHFIDYKLFSTNTFEAMIPRAFLVKGTNTIAFGSKTEPSYYDLSLSLAWFEITPELT